MRCMRNVTQEELVQGIILQVERHCFAGVLLGAARRLAEHLPVFSDEIALLHGAGELLEGFERQAQGAKKRQG
jgi:hypothetical protein